MVGYSAGNRRRCGIVAECLCTTVSLSQSLDTSSAHTMADNDTFFWKSYIFHTAVSAKTIVTHSTDVTFCKHAE